MFTGLVREVARVTAVSTSRGITRLAVDAPACAATVATGDSLAVNGICLTVAAIARPRVFLDATPETRRVTTLRGWRIHDELHLEPALRVGDQVGGHFVYGHVDGIGRITRLARRGGAVWMTVALAPQLARQLVPKGAITVDGVSLTLDAGPFPGRFTVTLVPHTLRATRFARASVGEQVNIELDIMAKAARRQAPGAIVASSLGDGPGFRKTRT